MELVKAREQVIGREALNAISLRKNAIAAINAGFFKIGNSEDGRPSLSLIINGKIFGLKQGMQSLLIFDQGEIKISKSLIKISVISDQEVFALTKINNLSNPEDITLYNDLWGEKTLTAYNRTEIIINSNLEVTTICNHGDNSIPKGGYVLSLPKNKTTAAIKTGHNFNVALELLDETEKPIKLSNSFSAVTGIPILVQNGQVIENNSLSASFSQELHARTALGIHLDGTIIIAVAEHTNQNLKNLTLQQAMSVLKKANIDQSKLSLAQALDIIKKDQIRSGSVGLSLDEMSQFMIKLGCDSAINLDGGGSSTMFIDGKIVNEVCGDKDESLGINIVRPISDAIVVLPKN
ncbi:MAG: phosphodiester glycosidase family protein [Rickettsiaceae bacterium]|nr:MAG: phosphodiester glycosidase family protein [Rickettsiaceae bacterium]